MGEGRVLRPQMKVGVVLRHSLLPLSLLRHFGGDGGDLRPQMDVGGCFTPLCPWRPPLRPHGVFYSFGGVKLMLKVFCLIWEDSRAQ